MQVFQYLSPSELTLCMRVSILWRAISNDDVLWKSFCCIYSVPPNPKTSNFESFKRYCIKLKTFKSRFEKKIEFTKSPTRVRRPDLIVGLQKLVGHSIIFESFPISFYALEQFNFRDSNNHTFKKSWQPRFTNRVMIQKLDEAHISVNLGHQIDIYNVNSREIVRSLSLPDSSILTLTSSGENIYFYNGKLEKWNWKTSERLLLKEYATFLFLTFMWSEENFLCFCDNSNNLTIFNMDDRSKPETVLDKKITDFYKLKLKLTKDLLIIFDSDKIIALNRKDLSYSPIFDFKLSFKEDFYDFEFIDNQYLIISYKFSKKILLYDTKTKVCAVNKSPRIIKENFRFIILKGLLIGLGTNGGVINIDYKNKTTKDITPNLEDFVEYLVSSRYIIKIEENEIEFLRL